MKYSCQAENIKENSIQEEDKTSRFLRKSFIRSIPLFFLYFFPQQARVGNGLPLVRSRERIEFPGNAVGIIEADVLVMSLWIFLHSVVEDSGCV
jgi:hypothetical protein